MLPDLPLCSAGLEARLYGPMMATATIVCANRAKRLTLNSRQKPTVGCGLMVRFGVERVFPGEPWVSPTVIHVCPLLEQSLAIDRTNAPT